MAGVFESVNLQGSSMAGESFVAAPVDYSGVAQAGLQLYGAGVQAVTEHRVKKEMDSFLEGSSEGEVEGTIPQGSPSDEAVVNSIEKEAARIQQAVDSRAISAAEARTRINNKINQGKAAAPFMSRRLDALDPSRDSGSAFNAEADFAIKAKQQFDMGLVKAGGDPNDPEQVLRYRKQLLSEARSQEIATSQGLTSPLALNAYSEEFSDVIAYETSVVDSIIKGTSSLASIDSDILTTTQNKLTMIAQGGATQEVDKWLSTKNLGPADITPEAHERMVKQLENNAKAQLEVLSGKRPLETLENMNAARDAQVWKSFSDAHPDQAALAALIAKVNAQDYASKTALSAISDLMAQWSVGFFKKKPSNLGVNDSVGGTQEGVDVQNEVSKNFDKMTEWYGANAAVANTSDLVTYAESSISLMEDIQFRPEEFTPKLYSSMLNMVNSPSFANALTKLDGAQAMRMKDQVADMAMAYTEKSLVPAISTEMGKDFELSLTGTGTVSDAVSMVPSVSGGLKFVPNSNLGHPRDLSRATMIAKDLNKKFSTLTAQTSMAIRNVEGLSPEQHAQTMLGLYSRIASKGGVPLRSEAADASVLSAGVVSQPGPAPVERPETAPKAPLSEPQPTPSLGQQTATAAPQAAPAPTPVAQPTAQPSSVTVVDSIMSELPAIEGVGDDVTATPTVALGVTAAAARQVGESFEKDMPPEKAEKIARQYLEHLEGEWSGKPGFQNAPDNVKKALVETAYNLPTIIKANDITAALEKGEYENVAIELLDTAAADGKKAVKGIAARRARAYNEISQGPDIDSVEQREDGTIIYRSGNQIIFKYRPAGGRHPKSEPGVMNL